MRLGVSYPKGPLSWAQDIGYAQIVAVLDHLYVEFGEDRYRTAPLLRRWARHDEISRKI
jgi:3-hydroxybutyryl-CoA dehydrogenase